MLNPHKRTKVLEAIVDHFNAYLSQIKNDGGAPVLPPCRLDDPRDQTPSEGEWLRHLRLFTEGTGRGEQFMGESGAEIPLTATLEWLVTGPSADFERLREARDGGVDDIRSVFSAIFPRIPDLQTGEALAVSAEITAAEFPSYDFGEFVGLGTYVTLEINLNAEDPLS